MQYTFFLNQKRLYELGMQSHLDVIDMLLFDAIYKWFNNEKLLLHAPDGTTYIEVRHTLIQSECPVLGINHRDTFRKRMLKLVDAGLLVRYENNQTENHSLYKRGPMFNCFDSDRGLPIEIDRGADQNRQGVQTEIGTNNILNNNGSIDNDKSLSLFNSSNEDLNAVDTHARKGSYQWLIDYWNEHAAPKGYSKLIRIDGKRLTATRARLKEYGADAFKQAIDKACASDFLRGQNRSGFTLTFDWMIKPTNFPKVLEGNYDNPQTTPTTNDTDNHNTGHPSEQNNSEGVVQEPFIIIDEERMRLWETKRILVP